MKKDPLLREAISDKILSMVFKGAKKQALAKLAGGDPKIQAGIRDLQAAAKELEDSSDEVLQLFQNKYKGTK